MSDIRASDAERETTARQIREHYAAGRLDQDELDERLSATYSAQTVDELAQVRADLPALPPSATEQRAELGVRRAHLQRQLVQEAGGSFGLFVVCCVIWLTSGHGGHHGQFWPIWVGILPLLALARNGWRLYGPAPELDRVEAELERRRREHGPERAERRERRELRRGR